MSTPPQPSQTLFDLLPALYRIQDAQVAQSQGLAQGPLQSLLMLIEEQFAVLTEDLNQLYDDQFIETCASWVVPYIGDLIGYKPVHGVATAIASPRAEVAQTVSFRRRKGTILVLEQLARDVTGWGAHALEIFQLLAATQYMKAVRPCSHYAPDLRRWQVREFMGSGFDRTAHTADVRLISSQRGRYSIQNVAVFLWSLNAYSLTNTPLSPVAGSAQFFRFSPLGADMPLFRNPVSQGPQIASPAQPANVPARLTRRLLCQDIQSASGNLYYGPEASLSISLGGVFQNPYHIAVCNLSGPDGSWNNVPLAGGTIVAAIDPELGRLALAAPSTSATPPQAQFHCGFNGDMGGGEYTSRAASFVVQPPNSVLQYSNSAPSGTTLQSVLNAATTLLDNPGVGEVAVEITDSWVYSLPSTAGSALQIAIPYGTTLELRAAAGCRPTLLLGGEITAIGGPGSTLVLNGLLIAYAPPAANAPTPTALVHAANSGGNQLGQITVTHCTLVPGLALGPQGTPQFAGQPVLVAELPGMQIAVQQSIVGGIQVQKQSSASFTDSVLDACSPSGVAYSATDGSTGGGSLTLQGCTVIGKLHAMLFSLVSNSILWAALASPDTWTAPVLADRQQQGCIRFSYLPPGAVVPRQFESVPAAAAALTPIFYSLQYGDPGYAKLHPATDNTIRRGADDGGEMGAFHFVLAPMRETDLLVRIQEYLPAGLQSGIFYQN